MREQSTSIALSIAKTSTLVLGLGMMLVPAAHSTIDNIQGGARCQGVLALNPGTAMRVGVAGDGVDFVKRVESSQGVTGSVVSTRHATISRAASAVLEIRARADAAPGLRTVTMHYPTSDLGITGTDTFQVRVLQRARVDRLTAPDQSAPFRSVDISVEGFGLPSNLSARTTVSLSSFGGSLLAGGTSGGTISRSELQRISTTRATLHLEFPDRMQRANLTVAFEGSDNCSLFDGPVDRSIVVEAPGPTLNYVKSVRTDPLGHTPSVGDVATLVIRLREPARAPVDVPTSSGFEVTSPLFSSRPGETVHWRLAPSSAFRQSNGNPLPTLAQATVSPGQDETRITFLVGECPGKAGRSNRVALQTFMHDTSANRAPERFDFAFSVSCPDI